MDTGVCGREGYDEGFQGGSSFYPPVEYRGLRM